MLPIPPHARIALFHFNGLGDHVLAWPAIRAIAHAYPSQVTLLEGPGQQFTLYQDVSFADRRDVVFSDVAERDLNVSATLKSAGECDVFISLAFWVNPTLLELAHRMGARRVIGRYFPFSEHVAVEPLAHMFEQYFALARHVAPQAQLAQHSQAPVCSQAARSAARDRLAKLRSHSPKLLFVHPETAASKMWSAPRLAAALNQFLVKHPDFSAVVVSAKPYALDVGEASGRVLCIEPHFELAMAYLLEADLFLGVDSVFMHLADLAGIPSVALFGPLSDPRLWGFGMGRGHVLCADPLSSLEAEPVVVALDEMSRS